MVSVVSVFEEKLSVFLTEWRVCGDKILVLREAAWLTTDRESSGFTDLWANGDLSGIQRPDWWTEFSRKEDVKKGNNTYCETTHFRHRTILYINSLSLLLTSCV